MKFFVFQNVSAIGFYGTSIFAKTPFFHCVKRQIFRNYFWKYTVITASEKFSGTSRLAKQLKVAVGKWLYFFATCRKKRYNIPFFCPLGDFLYKICGVQDTFFVFTIEFHQSYDIIIVGERLSFSKKSRRYGYETRNYIQKLSCN